MPRVLSVNVSGPNPSSMTPELLADPFSSARLGRVFDAEAQAQTATETPTRVEAASIQERRERGVRYVLSLLADLLGNVVACVEKNRSASEPAKANERLLTTAQSVIEDMRTGARVAGKRLFDTVHAPGSAAIGSYALAAAEPSDHDSEFLKAAKSLMTEVAHTVRSQSSGSVEDAERLVALLTGLESRIRSLRPGDLTAAWPVGLDVKA